MSECDVLDIHGIMRRLAEKRPIFHGRPEFHAELRAAICEALTGASAIDSYKYFPEDRRRLNIFVNSHGIAIELRYPTVKMSVSIDGEQFKLGQWQPPKARYDFLRDIAHLERIVAECPDAERGFAVLLTNNRYFWDTPASEWKNRNDAEFRIHDGVTVRGEMAWSDETSSGTNQWREESIKLQIGYAMNWRDYSDLKEGEHSRFRYLAVEVGN